MNNIEEAEYKFNTDLKKQYCTFEDSKRLQELGIKQKSLFYYVKGYEVSTDHNGGDFDLYCNKKHIQFIDSRQATDVAAAIKSMEPEEFKEDPAFLYSTFNADELCKLLPWYLDDDRKKKGFTTEKYSLMVVRGSQGWHVGYNERLFFDKELVNALSHLLIYLLENNLYPKVIL